MPIPINQVTVAEIHVLGQAAAGGGQVKKFDLVFHYRRLAVAVNPTKVALDTIFQASVVLPLVAALNARYTQVQNTIRWMNDAEDPDLGFAHAAVGAVAGDSMPTHEAAFLLFRSALRGRSGRGGKHLGPMSEADTTAGTDDIFNAAALARLATTAAAFILGLNDATTNVWVPVVLSRKAPAQYRINPTNVVSNDITACLVNKRVGQMKHRRIASVY
jgi:hypothetical protein